MTTGTTSPIFIPRAQGPAAVRPNEDYYLIRVHSAQATCFGSIWERAKRVVVASRVHLHHAKLHDESLHALQRSREVQKNSAVQLGLQPMLVALVPAVMTRVSVSIEFLVDTENRLAPLVGLINDDAFLATVSLAPGVAAVAKKVSGLARSVVQAFLPEKERKPVLQFDGDFPIAGGELQEGYYAILGTRDEAHPLPSARASLTVEGNELRMLGRSVKDLSYVVLEVVRTPARTRGLNEGAEWDDKLRAAEDETARIQHDPRAKLEDREQAWKRSKELIAEAQTLLRADANYLPSEAQKIWLDVYRNCAKVLEVEGVSIEVTRSFGSQAFEADTPSARKSLGIRLDADLEVIADQYATEVRTAEADLRRLGLFLT